MTGPVLEITPAQRRGLCSDYIGHERRPDEVSIVTALPMTPSGKVDRQRLLEEAGRSWWGDA
jgi:acyl-CoA synthetase (AMP-forming)/AMP-acid ligase II